MRLSGAKHPSMGVVVRGTEIVLGMLSPLRFVHYTYLRNGIIATPNCYSAMLKIPTYREKPPGEISPIAPHSRLSAIAPEW
ncbi:MAG: hypothetical protein F6J93_18305 [Oscillatoria sp. SIO1A7]|nr:hypothetical protein [Oscillatoria sp. SIO1A7]